MYMVRTRAGAGDQRSQGGDTFPDIAPARGGVWTP
jgi:hypothetical protein